MIREAVFAYTDAMKHTAAIFDVDGVLVNSPHERAWRESLQQLMEGAWRPFADQTMYSPDAFSSAVYQEFLAGKPRAAGAKAALEHFGGNAFRALAVGLIASARATASEDRKASVRTRNRRRAICRPCQVAASARS